MSDDYYICPRCGEEVKVGSKRCTTCDPPKPWEQGEHMDGVDIDVPEDDTFDYDQYIDEEFGDGARTHNFHPVFIVAAAIFLLIWLATCGFFH
jgi:hypothetical protein